MLIYNTNKKYEWTIYNSNKTAAVFFMISLERQYSLACCFSCDRI